MSFVLLKAQTIWEEKTAFISLNVYIFKVLFFLLSNNDLYISYQFSLSLLNKIKNQLKMIETLLGRVYYLHFLASAYHTCCCKSE